MIFFIFALFVFDLVIQIKVPIKKKKMKGTINPQGPINHPCIFRLLPLKALSVTVTADLNPPVIVRGQCFYFRKQNDSESAKAP